MRRFTSKADIEATQTDVCFVPIADIVGAIGQYQNPLFIVRLL
jgi:hypothetical protein